MLEVEAASATTSQRSRLYTAPCDNMAASERAHSSPRAGSAKVVGSAIPAIHSREWHFAGLAHRFLADLPGGGADRPAAPLRQAVGDHLHRRGRGMAEAGISGDFAGDALAFVAQHIAHRLQFEDHAVDFLHRGAGDAPDQRIEVFRDGFAALPGDESGLMVKLVILTLAAQKRHVAADEFANFA